MMIFLHVLIAMASVAWSTFLLLRPTKNRLQLSYVLIGLTIASGTYLALSAPAHMLETCLFGLAYITGTAAALAATIKKLHAKSDTI